MPVGYDTLQPHAHVDALDWRLVITWMVSRSQFKQIQRRNVAKGCLYVKWINLWDSSWRTTDHSQVGRALESIPVENLGLARDGEDDLTGLFHH